MSDRVAFITGASSGIGYAAALAFARHGTHVGAMARRADRLQRLGDAIQSLPEPHGDYLCVTGDVRDWAAVQAAVDATVARFGRLDILVANAGVGHRGSVADAEWSDLDTLLRTNIDGVLHSVRAAVPAMRRSGGGHILIISSITAYMPGPYMALYAASKTFVSELARSLRSELRGDNIAVTDVRLGRTQSEFAEKRLGKAGYTSRFGPSYMPAERVAEALVRATERRPKVLVLRPIDRLIILANRYAPGLIARLVEWQYK